MAGRRAVGEAAVSTVSAAIAISAATAACLRPISHARLVMISAATRLTLIPVVRLQREEQIGTRAK